MGKRVWRSAVPVIAAVAAHFLLIWLGIRTSLSIPHTYIHLTNTAADHLLQWDSQWYAAVGWYGYHIPLFAQNGFALTGNKIPFVPSLRATVYFPLLPVIVHLVGLAGALILTNGVFVATVILMYNLFRETVGDNKAAWGILLYSVNPALVYESSLYVEAYLILFSLLVVYGLRQGTKSGALLANAAGFLASLTHETGIFVAVFALWHVRKKRNGSAVGLIGSVLAGWGVYLGYLWVRYNKPFVMFSAEKTWNRTWRFPGTSFVHELEHLTRPYYPDVFGVTLFTVLMLSFAYAVIRRDHRWSATGKMSIVSLEMGLWVSVNFVLSMITYVPSHPLMSAMRLMSVAWPVYSLFGIRERTTTLVALPTLILFCLIGYFGAIEFTHGYFFQ